MLPTDFNIKTQIQKGDVMKTFSNGTLLITNGRVYLPDKVFENGQVLVESGKIAYVGSDNLIVPDKCLKVDARGGMICPGFIDLHVNGGGAHDITEGTEDAVYGIARGHSICGTTGLLVAVTGPSESIAKQSLQAASKLSTARTGGSKILGIHMEGPYINPKRQGPVFRGFPDVTSPNIVKMKEFVEAADGALKIVTMAPELDGALDVIEYLVSEGIIASVGHTEATYEEVMASFRAGVSYAAHIYNAMTPIHHRKPGTAGALLTSSNNVHIELVADGYHVHPGAIGLLLRTKGINNIILASDATEVVGTDLTSFTLPIGEGLTVEVRDGRTWGPEGQLIGSVLQMNHAIRNMKQWFNLPLTEIINAASLTPAKLLGIDKITGSLEVGKAADIAVLGKDYEVLATIVDGEVVYGSPEKRSVGGCWWGKH